jgi:hypothetical protein
MIGDAMYIGGNSTSSKTAAYLIADSYQIRAANALTARSENVAGFQGSAIYSLNIRSNDNPSVTTQTSQGATDYRMFGFGGNYTGVKNLNITAAWNRTDLNRANDLFINSLYSNGTATVLGSALGTITPAAQAATNNKQTDSYASISYDFGIAKVSLQTIGLKVQQYGNDLTKRTANQVAVNAPITSTIAAWAAVSSGKRSTWAASTLTAAGAFERERNFSGFQVGSTYALSKRTSLYGIYGQTQQDAITVGNANFKDQQYALGMRHTF